MERYSNFPINKVAIPGTAGGVVFVERFQQNIEDMLERALGVELEQQRGDVWRSFSEDDFSVRKSRMLDVFLSVYEEKRSDVSSLPEDLFSLVTAGGSTSEGYRPISDLSRSRGFKGNPSKVLDRFDYANENEIIWVGPETRFTPSTSHRGFIDALNFSTIVNVEVRLRFRSGSMFTDNQVNVAMRELESLLSEEASRTNQIVYAHKGGSELLGWSLILHAGVLIHERGISTVDTFELSPGDFVAVSVPEGTVYAVVERAEGNNVYVSSGGEHIYEVGAQDVRPVPEDLVPSFYEELWDEKTRIRREQESREVQQDDWIE